MKKIFVVSLLHLLNSFNVHSQVNSDTLAVSTNMYLNLFIDGAFEYEDYMRQQITFVNYVRDRHLADVHLLITTRNTGSDGTEYTLFYFGQKQFEGKNDTLTYFANTNNTEEEMREGLVQVLTMGLMWYIARLPGAGAVAIICRQPSETTAQQNTKDKWNNWVFTVSANTYFSGEKSYHNFFVSGSASAGKVTDEWKINASVGGSYNYTEYAYDAFTYVTKTQSKNADALVVKSITDHWSAGASGSIYSSTYSNYDIKATLSPAIEWDLFPYSKSTSRLFTVLYRISPGYSNYTDTTLYNKTEEFLVSQSITAALALIEKWGSVTMSVFGSNYFHDFSKNSVYLSGSANLRIVKGLELNLYGNLGFVHDQLSLPKEGATPEEVLTRQRELSTNFNYYGSVGLSYTFGSIFNNVVNPRMNLLY